MVDFLDRVGWLHIWTHSGCDCRCKTYASSRQITSYFLNIFWDKVSLRCKDYALTYSAARLFQVTRITGVSHHGRWIARILKIHMEREYTWWKEWKKDRNKKGRKNWHQEELRTWCQNKEWKHGANKTICLSLRSNFLTASKRSWMW